MKQFEQEFAERIGARYAIVVNSCTAAQHWRRGNVVWGLAITMALGSIPGALMGVGILAYLRSR